MSHKRYAYCLGANGPRSSWYDPLKYAEKDAERLATALTTSPCNFAETKWGVATDRNNTLAGLSQFVRQCKSADLLVVHFSGHALLDEDLYLLCNETDCDDLVSSAIEIGAVMKILSRSPARYNLLILDCCHAGGAHRGAFKGGQDVQDALNRAFQGSANVILSACARYERTRELDTLDGGAGFLSWALAVACTTHFQEASQDGHSLSLANILRWLPVVLNEINHSLNKNEQVPLPEALIYTRGGDGEIWFTEPGGLISSKFEPDERQDREHRLKAMLADHSGFMRDRLESFVGRKHELAEVKQRIVEQLGTGGYVTITGQAGQGKSSIVSKLVEEYGSEKTAFHFIPFNPGPDHQVGLLRNLMARLILRYQLSDIYVASESRPVLRDYFPKVLEELVAKGGQEVIFIDGLDQLEEDATGVRDLSFLPNNPPPGVVFVLGTRPNDALRPLELLKPYYEYKLPNLSRDDFGLLLNHRKVRLNRELTNRFYEAMQENALYLDLVAKELAEVGATGIVEVIKRVADNPNNIFSLSMARFKRQPNQWREVIKPVLGVLLTTREPLAVRNIRQILGVEDDWLREGLVRLGGLIARDGQHRCYLFHLKLRDYLRQDEVNPEKEYIFATDEQEEWHAKLANWCERNDPSAIWQDVKSNLTEQGRREYARRHYIAHLYEAREWQRLFAVLDTGTYGQAKIRWYDPSTRSYAQDLYLGRKAATREEETTERRLALLPNLWRYTLLQCSLTSRADKYTTEMFEALLLLGREVETVGLAELLTKLDYKVRVLLRLAKHLGMQQGKEQECLELLMRSLELTRLIDPSRAKTKLLCELSIELARAKQWEQAEAVALTIIDSKVKTEALRELITELVRNQQWEQADRVTNRFEYHQDRASILLQLGTELAKVQQWEQAKVVLAKVEKLAPEILEKKERVKLLCELGTQLDKIQQREQANAVWIMAEMVACEIQIGWVKARTLGELSMELAKAHRWEQAKAIAHKVQESSDKARVLGKLSIELAGIQQWEQAKTVACTIEPVESRVRVLLLLGAELAEADQWVQIRIVWDEILLLISEIGDRGEKDRSLRELGIELAKAQQWEQGEKVARSIKDHGEAVKALSELGRELAKAQQWKRARAIWTEAEVMARGIQQEWIKTKALGNLGIELAKAQQWEQAERVARSIEDRKEAVEVLDELGMELARAQQWERAKEIWTNPEVLAFTSNNNEKRARMFLKLGVELAREQQWELAKLVWAEAEAFSHKVEYCEVRAKLLLQVGIELAKAEYWEQAKAVWIQARAIALTAEHNEERAVTLLWLGKELARVEYWEQAEEMWKEVPELVHTIEIRGERDKVWLWLYKVLANAQQWEHAERVVRSIEDRKEAIRALSELGRELANAQQWEHAERVVRSIEDRKEAVKALSELGRELAKAQQWERARAIWALGETVANRILDNQERSSLVKELGALRREAQQWEQAESVSRSIECRRETVGVLDELTRAQQWERAKVAEALGELGRELAKTQQWERAKAIWALGETVAHSIQERRVRTKALEDLKVEQLKIRKKVVNDLASIEEYEQKLRSVQRSWLNADTRENAIELLPLITDFILLKPDIGISFYEAFTWVDMFMKG